MRARTEIPFEAAVVSSESRMITTTEFDAMIRGGQMLVIIDDMVVDVSQYMFLHPGGQFSLK